MASSKKPPNSRLDYKKREGEQFARRIPKEQKKLLKRQIRALAREISGRANHSLAIFLWNKCHQMETGASFSSVYTRRKDGKLVQYSIVRTNNGFQFFAGRLKK